MIDLELLNLSEAKYQRDPITGENVTIQVMVDGKFTFVPMNEESSIYLEIKRRADAGELTIADADPITVDE